MSINSLFNIAASGIAAQSLALEVTGENISNVNTPGYSRQTVNLVSKLAINSNGLQLGSGVQVDTVKRAYDGMLQQQIVNGNSSYQQNLAQQTSLQQIEPSFNELNSDGLGSALTGFFGAWQDLSLNPQGTAERQTLISKSNTLADNFNAMSASLTGVANGANGDLTAIASDITGQAKNLALVNSQLVATQAVGGNSNELMDQRDLLVQQIAQNAGVTSSLQPDGTATVTLLGGEQLVNGNKWATVSTSVDLNSSKNDLLISALGNPPASGGGGQLNNPAGIGGKLGGTLAVRDSIVPGYKSSLDSMASQLITAVNNQQGQGTDLNGNPGVSLFSGTSAAGIAVAGGFNGNMIAAASQGGSLGDNSNALAMASIENTTMTFTTPSGTPVSATTAGFYNALTSTVGSDVQTSQNTTSQGSAFLLQLNNLRSSNAGVSLDEELTNLTKYQQAYQGAAKVLSTATSMIDTIMAVVGT